MDFERRKYTTMPRVQSAAASRLICFKTEDIACRAKTGH